MRAFVAPLSAALCAAALCLAPSVAGAVMPPHVTSVSPGDGEPLIEGRIVKFHGYTLGGAERDISLRDASGNTVEFESFVWSRQECRGRPGPCAATARPVAVGAEQTYSVISVKLPPVPEGTEDGARFTASLLGTEIVIEVASGAYRVAE